MRPERCSAVSKLSGYQCEMVQDHGPLQFDKVYDHAAPSQNLYWTIQKAADPGFETFYSEEFDTDDSYPDFGEEDDRAAAMGLPAKTTGRLIEGPPEPSPWSNITQWVADPSEPRGGRHQRLSWKQVAEDREKEIRELRKFRQILFDLDRNENGRHEGDGDVGDLSGISMGNPRLSVGDVLGYDISGRRYIIPGRADRHDPDAWGPFREEKE